jgi:2-polyprenyl-3-methyl-5-hydroxy-6-metoxy-1,4-benzoquinol methylase
MSNELRDFRLRASVQSGGISNANLYQFVAKVISQFPQRGTIIDLGSGTGEFLRSLQIHPSFEKKIATDLMNHSEQKDEAVTWMQCDLNDSWKSIPNATSDWVVGIEVIEHLENPRHFVRECKRILKSKGMLLITTPNNESLRALLSLWMRGNFVDFLDSNYPAHITPLLEMDLKRILLECGFELIETGYSPWGTPPVFTSMEWRKISLGLLKGKRFSNHVYLVARSKD